ncbi:DUF1127 domain-containing protein [Pseudomonas nicosulfuronedens]|uniref:DUF1127 domain-containing protein n=1 Tax=Pseudomonas nicosulfuronedens TaxID=2571105 RepID=A0A5R9RD12_9PSED|nr:DUF1127 domain-containing protein [Pseudomonas nicosulfuronedens]MDH1009405.1 DUF1127 domain-containing protein [Pseudomonas nicosulfuronedens]MDH1978646.1 DUF1127 domain-containing protein [Pseudomonas nicosulfuronedens]MDH2026493.1 DUF1127 domain-containing protein [Pseudomonas nicosulfuronedens]TLX81224.1 DUF1127 domain-containing protein [Pseudomonas nicosulfuronedens]
MERALSSDLPTLRPAPLLRRLPAVFREWLRNARTRRQLAELTSLQLADLGISPSERVREISKPFWR